MIDRWPGLKFLAFSILCVLAAAYVISVTGNVNRLPFVSSVNRFEAELADVAGLFPGDDVRLAGVRVGRVNEISTERGRAVVGFELRPDIEITDTWEVGARWRNVIGQRYLYLYDVGSGEPLEEGARIPVERSRQVADIGQFFNEITPLLQAIDAEKQNQLLDELNTAIVGNEQEVQELVANLGSFGNTVADQSDDIRSVLRNGNDLLAEYNERSDQLESALIDLSSVSTLLRQRNDEVIGAVTDIAEVQERFGELLAANDREIRDIVSNLEVITDTIGDNRANFERAIATSPDGLATYMLISRWGQWFNVRGVAAQVQRNGEVLTCRLESGKQCSVPNSAGPGGRDAPQDTASTRHDALTVVTARVMAEGRDDDVAMGRGR